MPEEITFGKGGAVWSGDTMVGYVDRTTEGTSPMSIISNRPGPVRWVPMNLGHEPIGHEVTTRREAGRLVTSWARPPRVEGMKREQALMNSEMVWSATLKFRGNCLGVDKYDDENGWHVHFILAFGAFCPSYSGGVGVRPSRVVADSELVRLLDEALGEAMCPDTE
jgi:hypothetical protein